MNKPNKPTIALAPTKDAPKVDAPAEEVKTEEPVTEAQEEAPKVEAPKVEEKVPEPVKAPEPPKAAPQPQKPAAAMVSVTETTAGKKLAQLIGEYKRIMSGMIVPPAQIASGASILNMIVNTIIAAPEPDVLKTFFKFLREEKDGLMCERKALRGISTLGMADNTKVAVVYSLFYSAVVKSTTPVNTDVAMTVVDANGRGSEILEFVRSRSGR